MQAVNKGTGAKGGVEEKVPVGAYGSTSTAERVKKERIVLERDSCPREKGKRKVAKVILEFAGAVGKQDTLRQLHQGELEQESELSGRRHRRHQRGSA